MRSSGPELRSSAAETLRHCNSYKQSWMGRCGELSLPLQAGDQLFHRGLQLRFEPRLRQSPGVPLTVAFDHLDKVAAHPGPVRFCYEAGPNGYVLQRQISQFDRVSCVVVAPSKTPRRPGERVKTDRRDARKLVSLFRSGELQSIVPPLEEEEAIRDLCRCRRTAQKRATASRHQLDKFLMRNGYIYRDGKNWTRRYWEWLRSLKFDDWRRERTFQAYLFGIEQDEDRVKRLDLEIMRAAEEEPYRTLVGFVRCFRGLDTLSAMVLTTELYAVGRFTTAASLMGFVGMVPSEDTTGWDPHRGPITKAGNEHLRRTCPGFRTERRPGPHPSAPAEHLNRSRPAVRATERSPAACSTETRELRRAR